VIDEATDALRRCNLSQANLLLHQHLLEARNIHQKLLLEASSKLAKTHLSRYARSVCKLSDQVNRKAANVNKAGARVQRLLSTTPVALMQMTIVLFRIAVANHLYQFQIKILEMSVAHSNLQSATLTAKRFSTATISTLKSSYAADSYPGSSEMARLERVTGLGERQIVMWFTNRRCRMKSKRPRFGQPRDYEIPSDGNSREYEIPSDGNSREYEIPSDGKTHSPPDSPTSMTSFSSQNRKCYPSSDDNFFQESSQQAELEFYKTMVCNNTRNNWDDFAEFFADIGRH
jgi:hypothetical protein